MQGWTPLYAAAVALALAGGLVAAPPPTAPAAPVAAQSQPVPHTHFSNGDPMADFFTALALRFEVMVVQSKAVDAYVLKDFDMPATLPEALQIARLALEPQGFTLTQSVVQKRIVVGVVTTEEARKLELSESPVSYGPDPESIDISKPDRQVTHLLPVNHPDMLDTLRRTATQDPAVSVDVTGSGAIGLNLILTGPALKVQRAVEMVGRIDKVEEKKMIARTLPLVHLNAQITADALNQGFAQDTAPMKAVVDVRTNSIIITGPEDRVMDLMVTLIGQDAKRGPVLPRPAFPPSTGPVDIPIPPKLPVPGAKEPGQPSAWEQKPAYELDENGRGGENAAPGPSAVARLSPANFSPNVKAVVFL